MSDEPTFRLNYVKALQDEITRERTRAEAAEQKLRELQERTRWIPVSERYPEDYLKVIAQTLYGNCDIGYYVQGRWVGTFHATVTHWQPLPEPPEAEND